jgi:transcriptional regulator with XRE-family HTH domain
MPLTIEEAFGLTLQEMRKARKISQEELGFESGYHRTYISQLERGLKSPSLRTIFQLAAALKASPSAIVLLVERAFFGSGQTPGQLGEQTNEDNPDRASD